MVNHNNVALKITKEIVKGVGTTGEAISPYIPLIKLATDLIGEIINIYETAEYNRKICNALVERVKLTENAIDSLQRNRQRNENNLRNNEYYKAFNRFIYILKEIKEFSADISNIHGFRKYTKANHVKDKFKKLTDEYDVAMKDLHFTIAVASEEQRRIDTESLGEDLREMSKYLEIIYKVVHENSANITNINDEITYIKNHLNDKTLPGVNKIDPKDLTYPKLGKSDDKRGKHPNFVVRRIFNGQEVACKSILKTEEEMKKCPKTQGHLKILMKLDCLHILKFHGISKIENNNNVMVFEWAERGTLRQLYEKKDIKWHYKVRIALNICRGLVYVQNAGILHHDLKCKNILMTEGLDPKIYNFELARYSDGDTTLIDPAAAADILPWLAPEKLSNSSYTTKCEIFSFGMLLWELTFEKIPYKGWDVEKITDHVIKGGRERLSFGTSIPKDHQDTYKNIISDTWKQNPQERIPFMKLLDMLEVLHRSIDDTFDGSKLLPDKTLDLDGSKEISDADLELPDEEDFIKPVISLEEGIQAFNAKDHEKAWECFNFHAENNNIAAKYWKGRYLWEGYRDSKKEREESEESKKERKEGKELLKEAADEGVSEAQLRYAFTFKNALENEDNRKTFMEYLKKAATEGNNATAQFNLGDIYYKGKCKEPKSEEEGIKWLRKAALQDNTKATEFLKQLGIDI